MGDWDGAVDGLRSIYTRLEGWGRRLLILRVRIEMGDGDGLGDGLRSMYTMQL